MTTVGLGAAFPAVVLGGDAGPCDPEPVDVGPGVVVLRVQDVERPAGHGGPDLGEHRAQRQLRCQRVLSAGSEHHRDGDPAEAVDGEPVEEELQQAGVGPLERGAGHDHEVGATHLRHQVRDGWVLPVEQHGSQRGEVDDEVGLGPGELAGDVDRCGEGAGLRLGVPHDDRRARRHGARGVAHAATPSRSDCGRNVMGCSFGTNLSKSTE
jgi:hypothetical protein